MKVLLKLSIERFKKFFLLTSAEKYLFLSSWLWLSRVRKSLRKKPFKTVLSNVNKLAEKRKSVSNVKISADDISLAVERCSGIFHGNCDCLPKALAGRILFARYGYNTVLRIGAVRSSGSDFTAHAWLESDGKIVVGDIPGIKDFKLFEGIEGVLF
ncbi:hypothetical protein B4O97_15995 [Marispirochaeta aestuarii]|uniref:Microcin J25-processing protein McjB C-terminal domain-containing protein n=1 Tax=Marispirochaeta aestuarii TaxID=1963862 RepID=A0A1Y1RUF4_9SPIO|nr:hypothetical protein B4O97_15995 [Marispirochaeta aestuarii]